MAQVQIIQPYQPQSDALEKVAAYCRVSTDSKDQLNSYRTQIGYYTDFTRMRVIFPDRQSASIRLNSSRFSRLVPVIPSSA